MIFFMTILPAFFALVNPVSNIAKPACMKNTNAPHNKVHTVFIDNISFPPYLDSLT